jgi:hypothetical protein
MKERPISSPATLRNLFDARRIARTARELARFDKSLAGKNKTQCAIWLERSRPGGTAQSLRPHLQSLMPKIKLRNRWLIYFIGGELLGSVEALTEQAAIELAIQKYKVTNPEQQKRLVARRYR